MWQIFQDNLPKIRSGNWLAESQESDVSFAESKSQVGFTVFRGRFSAHVEWHSN